MLIAAAIFDHCSVEFFELTRSSEEKLVFTHIPNRQMTGIHKMPVKQVRLSKKQPNIMISCGDESDLYVKLWNVSSSSSTTQAPVNSIQTNQIRHKYMAQGQEADLYSVAAKTSEVRIFSPVYHQGTLKAVSEVPLVIYIA